MKRFAEALHAGPRATNTTALVAALRSPSAYGHPVEGVELIETHISYVLLAGEFAYKIKKPVRLPFLDFSTLALRRRFCEEEVRLNRRIAPDLYLDVVTIGGDPPRFGAAGAPVEYAVRMRRFPQAALASDLARRGALGPGHVDALARAIAQFHRNADPIELDAGEACARAAKPALENFAEILAIAPQLADELRPLRTWTRAEAERLAPFFAARASGGFVRDGHGDLHLANIAFLDGKPVPFDGLEFDARLRQVDVMSEVAFTVMDLDRAGMRALAARFLDAYLQETGDYAGLRVLRFYRVYRALVRAKVACIRGDREAARQFVDLAQRSMRIGPPALFLMHGLPASGKTSCAQALLEALGAVRVRSDVERKRVHGLAALAKSGSAPGGGLYTAAASAHVYRRLAGLALVILDCGYPVIVDAASLERRHRDRFRDIARMAGAGFSLVACRAPDAVLRERLRTRTGDASEADATVLGLLAAGAEPLGADEISHTLMIETG